MPTLKSIFRWAMASDDEPREVMRMVRACGPVSRLRILDVGCGTGRYLRVLASEGSDITGLDANADLVESNRSAGFKCVLPDELRPSSAPFDVILMSQVIEHFAPADLRVFLDHYLDLLKMGGHLIVATPLLSPYFYDDFDHIKPYHPIGLDMVFGPRAAQVQYTSRNKIQLRNIWFRRSGFRISYARARYIGTPWTRPVQAIDFVLALLFIVSFGAIGRADGWVGSFEKVVALR